MSKTQKWEMHLERECGVWGEIEVDQRGEITMRAEETRRKRRRSSRVRGSTLEEAEQVEEEDDRVARQVLVQETTVEEVALPLSPSLSSHKLTNLKREITLLFLMIIIKKEKYYKNTMYKGFFFFFWETQCISLTYIYILAKEKREKDRESDGSKWE